MSRPSFAENESAGNVTFQNSKNTATPHSTSRPRLYLNLIIQGSRQTVPVFARVCPLAEFHYGEPFPIPSRAQQRFLVVRAARGPYIRVAASAAPVVATSDIDRCDLRVQGSVLSVRAMLGTTRVFTDTCSYKVYRNDGLVSEQF